MATRRLLAELSTEIGRAHGIEVVFESGGGVEVARRIRDGAVADLAVLAAEAIAGLSADGLLLAATTRSLFVSEVVAAVPGESGLSLRTERGLHDLLLASARIAYSTGPSGTAVLDLVRRWGLADQLGPRLVQAPPGVPVGSLLASHEADLGFQQRPELQAVAGITVLGPLPGSAAITSTFSAGVLGSSSEPDLARTVLDLLASPELARIVAAAGLTPAS